MTMTDREMTMTDRVSILSRMVPYPANSFALSCTLGASSHKNWNGNRLLRGKREDNREARAMSQEQVYCHYG